MDCVNVVGHSTEIHQRIETTETGTRTTWHTPESIDTASSSQQADGQSLGVNHDEDRSENAVIQEIGRVGAWK